MTESSHGLGIELTESSHRGCIQVTESNHRVCVYKEVISMPCMCVCILQVQL